VWELYIRNNTIRLINNAKKLHKITTGRVKTGFQCELLHNITDQRTKRERNLLIPVGRKNIQQEYRQARAFEALIGWWNTHDKTRLEQILQIIEPYFA